MLQSEQAWAAELYNGMEFNTREEVEDFVSAMEQMEPDQLLQIEHGRNGGALTDHTCLAVTSQTDGQFSELSLSRLNALGPAWRRHNVLELRIDERTNTTIT